MTHNTREVEETKPWWNKLKEALEQKDKYNYCKVDAIDLNFAIEDYCTFHQELQKARQDWLRSEIEKLEVMARNWIEEDNLPKDASVHTIRQREHLIGKVTALTSIITRYKEELLELDRKEV